MFTKVYSKTCVKRPLSKRPKMVFKTNYCLVQVKSILQYLRPSLSYQLSLRFTKVYSKTCVKRPLSKRPKMVFKTNYCLVQVKSILQYLRPSLSYQLSLRSLFCLFLSGHFIHRFYCTSNITKVWPIRNLYNYVFCMNFI